MTLLCFFRASSASWRPARPFASPRCNDVMKSVPYRFWSISIIEYAAP